MKKFYLVLASSALLLASGALAYNDELTTPDAITGATTQEDTTSDNLIGTSEINTSQIAGVWSDAIGIAAYNSEETLNAAGGKHAIDVIANGINEMMSRMNSGNISVEFTPEGRVLVSASGNSLDGTYEISGATITASVNGTSFPINAKVRGNKLQLFYPVEKMPQQILYFFNDYNIEGLYLGLQLKKQE